MVLEGQVVGGVRMTGKGSNHVFDEVVHAPVRRPHLNLGITGDLQNSQEERAVFKQPLLHRLFLPAVKPVAPASTHLTPEKPGRGLKFVLTLDDRVAGEGVLNERRGLPGFAPAPTGIKNDVLGQLVAGGQLPIKNRWLVEIGTSIDPIPLESHIVWAQITQLKHPGLNPKVACFFNGDSVGNDEIAIHKNVANAPFLNQPTKEGTPAVHPLAVRHTNIGREAEFPQGERHLGHRDATALQVAAETSKEQTDGAHQQQHRPVDSHLYESWRPSPAQTATRPSMDKILTRLNGAEAVPSGGRGPAPACAAAEERHAKPPVHR